MPGGPVLAVDLGGTKLAAALVEDGRVLERREAPTDREGGAAAWIEGIARLSASWPAPSVAAVAVTGLVRAGAWGALNPGTLPVPDDFPLEAVLGERLGVPVRARNDGQAAAWGEYRFGAGQGGSLLYVTVSTGIGGGLVLDGRLLEGRGALAGHLGITPVETERGVVPLEDLASGSALARLARDRGGPAAVTAAAERGETWAGALLDTIVAPLALALCRVQLVVDPDRVVVGGGLGLAPGYLDRLRRHLDAVPALRRPTVVAAALGADAGLVGVADLACRAEAAAGGK